MSRISGTVSFATLGAAPSAYAFQAISAQARMDLPGISLAWDASGVDVAFDGRRLALATGRARDPGSAASGEAERWLDRYDRRGESAACDVGGGFSAVIVDFDARCALLVVDRFAIESLCYRYDNGVLTFSDRACDVPSARAYDPQAVFDYLFFHSIPAPRTVYQGVFRLEGAQCIVASADALNVGRYWNPVFVEDAPGRLAARAESFLSLVQRAVAEEADGTRACFLSGGTDSSTIAGMLTRVTGQPAAAYSIGFEADGYDEMSYARIAARHFGLEHHEYYLTPDDLVDAIPRVAASLDQPFGNSSVLPAYYCALRARADGATRMLAGDGGDELFGGNVRYAVQKTFDVYHRLPAGLRKRVLEPAALRSTGYRRIPGLRQLGGYVRHAHPEMPDRLNAFNLLHFVGLGELLDTAFLARVDADSPVREQRRAWQAANGASLTNRMLAYDWKYTLADSDLPKVRAATQLAGVSVGYPFLSRELTDFSLGLPADWKVRRLTLRWFFKRALRDVLPAAILRKKKHGFGLPFGPWLLQHRGLRALAEDALDGVARRGIVRPSAISGLIETRLPTASGYYGELVWILMMLELWIRTHPAQPDVPGADRSHD